MLIRISLIIAILAGLAVGGLNFVKVKEKITTLQANLAEQTKGRQVAEEDARVTHKELDKTTADLKTTRQTLETTTAEKAKAEQEAAAQAKRADKLNDDLNKTRTERDNAQSELAAYVATGLKPEQIVNINKQFNSLQETLSGAQEENKLLGQRIKRLENELALYKVEDYHVPLPASLKGTVLAADPKWNFVVVSVGEDQGVLPQGELLVNRNGKLVAKIKVSTVRKDRCIANVMPGWQLGEVLEGDQVIPAYPAS